jgi:hypothetical protein
MDPIVQYRFKNFLKLSIFIKKVKIAGVKSNYFFFLSSLFIFLHHYGKTRRFI